MELATKSTFTMSNDHEVEGKHTVHEDEGLHSN
jgi:hypothetical protein